MTEPERDAPGCDTFGARLYGLSLQAPFEIAGVHEPLGPDTGPCYRVIVEAPGTIPGHRAAPVPFAQLSAGQFEYAFSELTDRPGCLLNFAGVASFVVDDVEQQIACYPADEEQRSRLPGLLAASVPAAILLRQGHLVLHGSGVAFGHRSVAILGGSGYGKSTLAAGLCADGARFLTDDVVRVDLRNRVHVFRGGAYLRMRPTSRGFAAAFDLSSAPLSPDGRALISPPRVETPQSELAAIVVLRVLDDDIGPALEPISDSHAVMKLLENIRILGWSHPSQTQLFSHACDVAARVPILELVLPHQSRRPLDRAWLARTLGELAS